MMVLLLTWAILALFAIRWGRKHHFFVLPERALFSAAPRFIHLLLAFVCMIGPPVALINLFPAGPLFGVQQHLEYVLTMQLVSYALSLTGYALLLYMVGPQVRHTIWSVPGAAPLKDNAKQAGLALVLSLPLVMALQGILDELIRWLFKLPILPDQTAVYLLKNSVNYPLSFIEALIAIIICAPLVEELFFRGFLQSFLRHYLSSRSAIIITALIFSFFHFSPSQGLSNIPIISALFVLACFLGMLYEKQRTLMAPILLHVFFNTFNAIQLYFSE